MHIDAAVSSTAPQQSQTTTAATTTISAPTTATTTNSFQENINNNINSSINVSSNEAIVNKESSTEEKKTNAASNSGGQIGASPTPANKPIKEKKKIQPTLVSTTVSGGSSIHQSKFTYDNINHDLTSSITSMFNQFSILHNQPKFVLPSKLADTSTTTATTTTTSITTATVATITTDTTIQLQSTTPQTPTPNTLTAPNNNNNNEKKERKKRKSKSQDDEKTTTVEENKDIKIKPVKEKRERSKSSKNSSNNESGNSKKNKEEEKRKKKKKKVKVSRALLELEPFSFLISAPPIHCWQFYLELLKWWSSKEVVTTTINDNIQQTYKTEFKPSDTLMEQLENYIVSKEILLEKINSPVNESVNQKKLDIIECIYSMKLENSSLEQNKMLKVQKELWWIKQSNDWLSKDSSSKTSYLKVWFGFLILELWYRFVWAKYTQLVYNDLNLDGNGDEIELTKEILEGFNDTDVIELKDLGQGEDEDDEDDDDDDELLDDNANLVEEDEDNEMDLDEKSTIATTTVLPATNDAKSDKPVSENPANTIINSSATTNTTTVITTSMKSNLSGEDKSSTEEIETEDNEEEGVDGNDEGDDVDQMEEDEDEDAKSTILDLVPKVVSMFFVHPTMTDIINEIESDYWDSGIWNITKAFETFGQIIHSFYRDNKSLPSLTFAEIHEVVHEIYEGRYAKFISNLGITFYGDNNHNWKWTSPSMELEFVDTVYKQQFSTLTQEGQVSHSHTFHILFPGYQDMKPPTHPIGDYYISLKTRLEKQGVFNKEVEKIVETLDRLVEERQLISTKHNQTSANNNNSDEDTNNNNNNDVFKAVNEYHQTRIRYLDQLIATLKSEYSKLTIIYDS